MWLLSKWASLVGKTLTQIQEESFIVVLITEKDLNFPFYLFYFFKKKWKKDKKWMRVNVNAHVFTASFNFFWQRNLGFH